MNSRLKRSYPQLQERGLDGLLLSSPANISYLTGSLSRDSYFLLSPKENIYFTDPRYTEEARLFLKGNARLKECSGSVFKCIAGQIRELGLKKVGFEERYLPFAEFTRIKELAAGSFALVPTHGIVEARREIKDKQEIARIREAARITALALEYIAELLAPGIREAEVAGELERFIRYNGARAAAFDIIVASGHNSSRPHHLTGLRKLREGEPVLIDLGVDFQGYKSDLTRVFFLGKMNFLVRKVYDIVLSAQELAIKKIRPGAEIAEIDRVARKYIRSKGYGGYFTHNLGHGLGLEVHEGPTIRPAEAEVLEPGMAFTVEPGIYLPGKFGIRIEDMVLVTKKGCEVLSGPVDK